MLYRAEQNEDGSIRLHTRPVNEQNQQSTHQTNARDILKDINEHVESCATPLWVLNKFIHDNPELAFQEHKAHDALTTFMDAKNGWLVTKSAYGLETAWIAEYESGKPGPIVSFNAEMGM